MGKVFGGEQRNRKNARRINRDSFERDRKQKRKAERGFSAEQKQRIEKKTAGEAYGGWGRPREKKQSARRNLKICGGGGRKNQRLKLRGELRKGGCKETKGFGLSEEQKKKLKKKRERKQRRRKSCNETEQGLLI